MPWIKLRTIVYEDSCTAEIAAANEEWTRFDEAWEGVEWLLARNPRPPGSFLSLNHDGHEFYIYGCRGDADADVPDMWIFYRYNEDEVVIYGINANEPVEDEEA